MAEDPWWRTPAPRVVCWKGLGTRQVDMTAEKPGSKKRGSKKPGGSSGPVQTPHTHWAPGVSPSSVECGLGPLHVKGEDTGA